MSSNERKYFILLLWLKYCFLGENVIFMQMDKKVFLLKLSLIISYAFIHVVTMLCDEITIL